MSLNHFVSDFSQTHWWQQPQQHEMMEQPSKTTSSTPSSFWSNSQFFTNTFPISCSALRFDLNNQEDKEINHKNEIIKEPLFEKPLTPSDVGKLNRLVIPKQHAEKHFPLNGVSESGEKGLLLSFEDELGKPWRFRYSYWNSSQSYVLTKGWSRFVKEKKLNAGDIVQFERHRLDCERMFIGWRKRRDVESAQPGVVVLSGGNGGWQPYQAQPHPAPKYPPDSVHAAAAKIETIKASGNCKRLRLFGVNMECQPSDDSDSSSHQDPGPSLGQCSGPANYNNQHYR